MSSLGTAMESTPRRPVSAHGRKVLGLGLLWMPVWVPLGFLGQLLWLGLRPARAEEARLERAEASVRARAQTLLEEQQELDARAHMLTDEVYQERVRRSLLDPKAKPLTLERARAGVRP